MPPTASTSVVIRLLRRLFVCRRGHAFMLRVSPEVVWLECPQCLTVRVVDELVTPADARVLS